VSLGGDIRGLVLGDARADRVVPPTGFTATLTVFASGAMAFLAVFALALAFATGRLAERWEGALAQTATIRLSAPEGEVETQIAAALRILEQTPGVAAARVMTRDEQAELLAPWFGPDLPLDLLPVPDRKSVM
jgi:cell division transport system permease protein